MRPLIPVLFLAGLAVLAQSSEAEPDGARVAGKAPIWKTDPAPPAWLRAQSHRMALVDTRHYLYEVYAATQGREPQWLVRYVMFPEGNEAFRELEQVFLFDGDPKHQPKTLKPGDLSNDTHSARWHNADFKLVDRRDLLAP